MGDVARALGRWEEAAQRYGQSLAYRERLRAAVGETPEVLDDIGVSLVKLAMLKDTSVERSVQRIDEAEAIYRRLLASCGEVAKYRERLDGLAQLRRQLNENDNIRH